MPRRSQRRRARPRPQLTASQVYALPTMAEPAQAPERPPGTRPLPSEARAAAGRATGPLPVFERSYLVSELRRIALISGSLLGLLVVLAIVLR